MLYWASIGNTQAITLGEDKERIQSIVVELVSAVRNISRDPESGEMNGQYEWDSLEIVLPFEVHSRQRLMIITPEELCNSQETSIWANIPSVTEASKKTV